MGSIHSEWILALVAILIMVLQSACSSDTSLDIKAVALAKTADECLADVRDREMTFSKSASCSSLSRLAREYKEAGGFRGNTPCRQALVAEQARGTAWMALAMSESGNRRLGIW